MTGWSSSRATRRLSWIPDRVVSWHAWGARCRVDRERGDQLRGGLKRRGTKITSRSASTVVEGGSNALGSLTPAGQRLIQLIYDVFRDQNDWPTYQYVDSVIYREYGDDAAQLLGSMAPGLVVWNRLPSVDSVVALRVAGISLAAGSDEDIEVFIDALKWLVDAEREFRPSSPLRSETLTLTSDDYRSHSEAQGSRCTEQLLIRVYSLITTENLPLGVTAWGSDRANWSITVLPEVRRFRQVESLSDYLRVLPTGANRMLRQAMVTAEPGGTGEPMASPDPRRVFVIHGRDDQARKAVFGFLRDLDLWPLPWEELVASTECATPYTGEVVKKAFDEALAVVAIFTPDDEVRLHPDLVGDRESGEEAQYMGQARPNVLLEAGMALQANPDRTILVEIGKLRAVSDLAGRNVVRLGPGGQNLHAFKQRLVMAGCAVNDSSDAWLDRSRFAELAAHDRRAGESKMSPHGLPTGRRVTNAPKPAEPRLTARVIDRGSQQYLLEVVNRGGVELTDVRWDLPPDAVNWSIMNSVLPTYPLDALPPRDYIRVPLVVTNGGPIVTKVLLSGDTPDHTRYETAVRLSVFG